MLDPGTSTAPLASVHDPVSWLRQMALIRAFDSQLPSLYTRGLVRGSSHAAIGQEAVAVGACAAIQHADYITSTHRGHGHAIAKGADVRLMMAELLGRETGYCRGKGGSMHIADFSLNMLGANGIVGGGFGLAAGAALTAQQRGEGRVALCFFGDGAINQGSFHGVCNLAAIWSLPLVFLCENNQFAMSGRVEEMTSVPDLAVRAAAYGFPGVSIDGMDVFAVCSATEAVVLRARSGERAESGRGELLSLRRPLLRRHDEVPHEGRGRAVARARPGETSARPAHRRRRPHRGRGGRDRSRGRRRSSTRPWPGREAQPFPSSDQAAEDLYA